MLGDAREVVQAATLEEGMKRGGAVGRKGALDVSSFRRPLMGLAVEVGGNGCVVAKVFGPLGDAQEGVRRRVPVGGRHEQAVVKGVDMCVCVCALSAGRRALSGWQRCVAHGRVARHRRSVVWIGCPVLRGPWLQTSAVACESWLARLAWRCRRQRATRALKVTSERGALAFLPVEVECRV